MATLDCSKRLCPMQASLAHQLILPTEKRNPCFSLYLSEDQQSIEVFYGMELLEITTEDPERPAFKMMAERLANAKVRFATLPMFSMWIAKPSDHGARPFSRATWTCPPASC